jgi:hypothetical protein
VQSGRSSRTFRWNLPLTLNMEVAELAARLYSVTYQKTVKLPRPIYLSGSSPASQKAYEALLIHLSGSLPASQKA